MKMVDVGGKEKTERVAVATARIRMLPATVSRIRRGEVEKGDVLAAARLAGVDVEIRLRRDGAEVRARVKTVDRTGVEMEALTSVTAAALTIYDMLKSVDRGMVIEAVQLDHKSGGRSGTWDRQAKPAKRSAPRGRGGAARR